MVESQSGQPLLFLLVVLVGFVLLVLRPQRARVRAFKAVRASLAPGVQVLTASGLYGRVVALEGEEPDEVVVLEIAPGVQARFAAAAVLRVLPDPPGPDPATGGAPAA